MDRKKSCNCLNACPCYPNCDQMMDGGSLPGQIPPEWLRGNPGEDDRGAVRRAEPKSQMPPMGPGPQIPPNAVLPGRVPAPGMPLLPGRAPALGRAPVPGMPQPDVPIGRWGMMPPPQRRTDQMGRPGPRMAEMPADGEDTETTPEMRRSLFSPEHMGTPAAGESVSLEEENERDWQKLKEQYPDMAKIILAEVEKICDSMEYEGSMMFDSMPDKVRILKLTEDIYEKVKDRYPVEELVDQDDVFVMNQEDRRRRPPKQNWLSDFVQVLLYQEMFRRRCRHRGCKRW